jgi:hypothetical protein
MERSSEHHPSNWQVNQYNKIPKDKKAILHEEDEEAELKGENGV